MDLSNIEIFVDNDYIQILNKKDKEELEDLENKYEKEIYSDEDNEIKRKFYELDKKITDETIQINYRYTSNMMVELFNKLGLPIKVTPA